MNIFILDHTAKLCAEYLHDKHVVKMVLETGQILSSVQRKAGNNNPALYKSTHPSHPCILWVSANSANYDWTLSLFTALSTEYTHRYRKDHSTYHDLIKAVCIPPNLPVSTECTKPALAMPPNYKRQGQNNWAEAIASYRDYYANEKVMYNSRWTNRGMPTWLD